MSSNGQLPDYIAKSLSQSVSRAVEAAIQDPAVYTSADLISKTILAVRRCVDEAVATALAPRNLPPKHDKLWPHVWAHLPLTDLLAIGGVCRAWRKLVLDLPKLWSRLEVHAWEGDEPDFMDFVSGEDAPTDSNLSFLRAILPRSKSADLTVEVHIESHVTTEDFSWDLGSFLDSVAPRLGALRIVTMNPEFPESLFSLREWTFPRLRSLSLLSDTPEDNSADDGVYDGFKFDCHRVSLPSLTRLEIHSHFRITYRAPYPALRHLSWTVQHLTDAAALLLSSPALDTLRMKCPAEPFDVDATPEHAQLVSALNAISDVYLITPRHVAGDARVFRVFGNAPRRRLLLDFDCSCTSNSIPFLPQPCSALTSATHLAISLRPDTAVVIAASDAAHPERIREIALTNAQAGAVTVDWTRIASLPDLVSLTVDARLWEAVMINFPLAPQLAQATLTLASPADLGTLLAARPIPRLPPGVPLSIDSAALFDGIPAERLNAVKEALGAPQITVL